MLGIPASRDGVVISPKHVPTSYFGHPLIIVLSSPSTFLQRVFNTRNSWLPLPQRTMAECHWKPLRAHLRTSARFRKTIFYHKVYQLLISKYGRACESIPKSSLRIGRKGKGEACRLPFPDEAIFFRLNVTLSQMLQIIGNSRSFPSTFRILDLGRDTLLIIFRLQE
jgi:hypothetical protein